MISKEQVIEITRSNCDEGMSDPFHSSYDIEGNVSMCGVGMFTMDEFMRIARHFHMIGVEDAILNKAIEPDDQSAMIEKLLVLIDKCASESSYHYERLSIKEEALESYNTWKEKHK